MTPSGGRGGSNASTTKRLRSCWGVPEKSFSVWQSHAGPSSHSQDQNCGELQVILDTPLSSKSPANILLDQAQDRKSP